MTHERASLHALERDLGREIEIRARMELHQEQFEIASAGEGEPVSLPLPWLAERQSERPGRSLPFPVPQPEAAEEPSAEPPAAPAHREFLSMSLLDDDEEDAGEAPEAPGNGDAATAEPVDEQGESPILPRFREQEEGV